MAQLAGCCLTTLFLSVAHLAAAAPATEPVRLPRSLGFQVAGQEPTASQAYGEVWYARRAMDETSLDAPRKQAAGRLLAEAEKQLRELAIKAQNDPATARVLAAQAAQIRDKLDQDLADATDDVEMHELIERIKVLSWQELLLFNGPSSFLSETAPASGLNLTADQQAKLQPILAAADDVFQARLDRLAQGGAPDPVVIEDGPGGRVAKLRSQIRAVLTPEQCQRWDQSVLEELAQMEGN